MSNMLASMQPPPKPRKRKAATLRDVDWEPHKERIMELHGSGMTLEDMKRTMELDFKFFAEYVVSTPMYILNTLTLPLEIVNTNRDSRSGA